MSAPVAPFFLPIALSTTAPPPAPTIALPPALPRALTPLGLPLALQSARLVMLAAGLAAGHELRLSLGLRLALSLVLLCEIGQTLALRLSTSLSGRREVSFDAADYIHAFDSTAAVAVAGATGLVQGVLARFEWGGLSSRDVHTLKLVDLLCPAAPV